MIATLTALALAATMLPPPGLYKVEIASDTAYRDGTTAALQQRGTGTGTLRAQKPGSAPTARVLPNTQARQVCIDPATSGGAFNPIALSGKSNCKNASVVSSATGATFTARCDIVDFTSVVRKIDAANWDITTQINEHLGGKGMTDFDQQHKMFEASLKNATTPEDRADAKYTLDHWEEYKADMRSSAGEAGAAAAPGAATRSTAMVTHLTRVADSCKAAR